MTTGDNMVYHFLFIPSINLLQRLECHLFGLSVRACSTIYDAKERPVFFVFPVKVTASAK